MFSGKKRNIGRVEIGSNEGVGRSVRPRVAPPGFAGPSGESVEGRRSGRLREREAEDGERRRREIAQEQALAAMRAGQDMGGIVESIERDGTRTVTPTVS